jgi:hypothetical protein
MNAYDPSDGRIYVQMAHDTDPYATPVLNVGRHNRLPSGYANKSVRTRLTGCAVPTTSGAHTSLQ